MANEDKMLTTIVNMLRVCENHLDEHQEERQEALEYYDGKMHDIDGDAEEERTRSAVVSMDVRATVRKLLPSIMRVLFSSDRMVEYVPNGPEDTAAAEAATLYVNKVLMTRCGARDAIYDALFDALVVKTGILKWYAVTREVKEVSDFSRQPPEALELLRQQGELTDVEEGEDGLFSLSVHRTQSETDIRLECIPRGQFLIHPRADSIESSPIVGERKTMTRSELVQEGYDRAVVDGLSRHETTGLWDDDLDAEERRGDDYETVSDDHVPKSEEEVLVRELYVRMDLNDDGVSELHRVILASSDTQSGSSQRPSSHLSDTATNYVILKQEEVNEAPYCPVVVEREPHNFEGHSIAEETMEHQRIKTSLLREALNNIYAVNNPQPVVDMSKVLDEDSLYQRDFNQPLLLRAGAAPREAVDWSVVPYVADSNFPIMDYIDRMIKETTGISDASGGLNADQLEHMKATTASIVSEAALAQAEMMVRTLKECVREAFRGLYRLVVNHVDRAVLARIDEGSAPRFVNFTPYAWDHDLDCTINTGLGVGTREREMNNLTVIRSLYAEIMQAMGTSNPYIQPHNIYALLEKTVEAAGFSSADIFFTRPTEESVQQWQQQQAESSESAVKEKEMQMEMQMKQAEMEAQMQQKQMEMQARAQAEAQKMQMDARLEAVKLQAQLQVEKAQMEADNQVKLFEAEMKARVDARMKAMEDENKAQMEAMKGSLNLTMHRERLEFDYDKLEADAEMKQKEMQAMKETQNARNDAQKQAGRKGASGGRAKTPAG